MKGILFFAVAILLGAIVGAILLTGLVIAGWYALDSAGYLDNHTNWYGLGATLYALPLGAIAGGIAGGVLAGRRS